MKKPVQKLYVIRVAQAGPGRSFWEAPPTDGGDVSSDFNNNILAPNEIYSSPPPPYATRTANRC